MAQPNKKDIQRWEEEGGQPKDIAKPIGEIHYTGKIEVPVYAEAEPPSTVEDVKEALDNLRTTLTDRRLREELSDEEFMAVLDKWAKFSILATFNVPTYPLVQETETASTKKQ